MLLQKMFCMQTHLLETFYFNYFLHLYAITNTYLYVLKNITSITDYRHFANYPHLKH